MDLTEIRSEMADIAAEQIEQPEGVHWVKVRESFAAAHPDTLVELGEQLAWQQLGKLAADSIKPLRSKSAQQIIPGMESTPASVTVPDGEGGFVVKALRHATAAELVADELIHDTNVAAAIEARGLARTRNRVLLPVMEKFGLDTAGEAIAHLTTKAAA